MTYPNRNISVCTQNDDKYKEYVLCLREYTSKNLITLAQDRINLIEPQSIDLTDVSEYTVKQAFSILKVPVITDDSGIYFSKFNKFPGSNTKNLLKTLGLKNLYNLAKSTDNDLKFVVSLTYYNGEILKTFTGELDGEIIDKYDEEFKNYNDIFIPKGHNKPLSKISIEERAFFSHRKKALDEFISWFLKF